MGEFSESKISVLDMDIVGQKKKTLASNTWKDEKYASLKIGNRKFALSFRGCPNHWRLCR